MAPKKGRRSGLPGAVLLALAMLGSARGAAGQAVAVIAHPTFPAAGLSLGIGHATLRDRWIYAGFSRGGFRLFRYDLNQD